MDEMQEIARFEESLEFLKDGLPDQMNTELKQLEAALEELKDADQRVSREINSIENLNVPGKIETINSTLEELVFQNYHHTSNQNQLTEQMVLDHIGPKNGAFVEAIEEILDNIEGIEEDEEKQLAEDEDAYEKINNNLEEAIQEHKSILIIKKDLKIAKGNEEFEQRIRTELADTGFDFDSVEELIQKVQQIQEESYEILEDVTAVLRDYKGNINSLVSELEEFDEQIEGNKRSTVAMVKRLATISRQKNWEDVEELAENLLKLLRALSNYITAIIGMDRKIDREINSIEDKVESYRDEYRREENNIR